MDALSFDNKRKEAMITLFISFFIIIGTVMLFVDIADDILEKEKFEIDKFFQHISWIEQENALHQVMSLVTEAGSVLFLVIASALVVVSMFLTKKSKWMIIFFVINMIGISTMTSVLKEIFQRDRPSINAQYDGIGFSFPSGHSTGSVAFYGFILYLLWRSNIKQWLKWLLIFISGLLAVMIPFSRVVLGVHYFTDILAGMALALAWLTLCILVLEFLSRRISS